MFSEKTLDFLFQVKINDSKLWYDEHKPEYEQYVINPFKQLVAEVGPPLLDLDPELVIEPKIFKTISRIHRDTRFSKDKSKYRDTTWMFINRDKKLYPHYPGFFFEITPSFVWWGCGMYFWDSACMDSFRAMVLEGDPLFMGMAESYDKQSIFELDPEGAYKRTKFPDQPEQLRKWLDRRSMYMAYRNDDPAIAFDINLGKRLTEEYKLLYPLYNCLLAVCQRRVSPEHVRPWSDWKQY